MNQCHIIEDKKEWDTVLQKAFDDQSERHIFSQKYEIQKEQMIALATAQSKKVTEGTSE